MSELTYEYRVGYFHTKANINVVSMSWCAVADLRFGKWGGFFKSGLFSVLVWTLVARWQGCLGVGCGTPLAPPAGSGAEPKLLSSPAGVWGGAPAANVFW
jgi:hypothetical protein